MKKEEVRSLEGEKDKDEDSCQNAESSRSKPKPPLDFPSLRRAYNALFKLPCSVYESPLVNALVTLAGYLQVDLQRKLVTHTADDIINVLAIVFEIPVLGKFGKRISLFF